VPLPAPASPAPARDVGLRAFTSETDFIEAVGAAARRSQRSTGVPASVTIAQAILESDWGRSRLTREANNLFGIKALSGPGPAGTVDLVTWEHIGDLDSVVQAPFRAYHSLEESVADHGAFFLRNGRYADALAVAADPQAFARAINQAGYATDPNYAAKLIRLMDRYDLYRFDRST
jgi:flagellum-specific peptidoglycan hydrolase FlgJ